MHRFIPPCAALFAIALSFAPARGAADPKAARDAIEKGKKFLYSKQRPEGRWEEPAKRVGIEHNWNEMQGDSYGGFTAVCTYALLAAGEKTTDPRIAKAVDFLKKADIVGVYALGLRAQVWPLLPQTPETRQLAQRDADRLMRSMIRRGPAVAMWDYGDGIKASTRLDHSASQYGVLGLWACAQAGAEVPAQTWEQLDKTWRQNQFPDGAWSYDGTPKKPSESHPPTPSMTAAGVATLFIIQDMIYASRGINCTGNISDPNIQMGLNWMGDHFKDVGDSYTLYGVERIGVASGYKYFGGQDWYAVGADKLMKAQRPDGSWEGGFPGATPLPTTAFAMLFLSRGGAPMVMNKLDYRPATATTAPATAIATDAKAAVAARASANEFPWNQRPRDVANLARFIGRGTETFLNWQIVNLAAPVDELHDAPILYIAGNKPLKFSAADEQKLKTFVYQGGLILGNSDCPPAAADAFSASFVALGARLFGSEFRALEPNHVILNNQPFRAARWTTKPPVSGLSNGVRELMILMPQMDPSRAWQTDAFKTRRELFELGADIFFYAVDKQDLQQRAGTHIVRATKPATHAIKVARLVGLGQNADPEPLGWTRLDAVLRNGYGVGVATQAIKVGEGKLTAKDFKVAHLTGTTKIVLKEEQRAELKKFAVDGGTLIVDAAGGAGAFADAAEKELTTMFGNDLLGPVAILPLGDEVYARPGAKIAAISYRPYAKALLASKLNAPRLRGIAAPGGNSAKLRVFYSREDLSAGLVGQEMDGIVGYSPETATALMRNILLYAAPPPKPPATAPANPGAPVPPAPPA